MRLQTAECVAIRLKKLIESAIQMVKTIKQSCVVNNSANTRKKIIANEKWITKRKTERQDISNNFFFACF